MLLLGGAESMRKNQIIGRVTWLSPLPGGDQRRPIIRSKRACSGSHRRTVSTSPLRCQPRRAAFPFCPSPVFHEVPRAARPWTTDDKIRSAAFLNFKIFAARDDFLGGAPLQLVDLIEAGSSRSENRDQDSSGLGRHEIAVR